MDLNLLQPGDIFMTNGSGLSGWASEHLTIPHTKHFHHGLIGDAVWDYAWDKIIDYETRESISKGPSCNRLSNYNGVYLEIYRVKNAAAFQKEDAVRATSLIGQYPYDYQLFLALFFDVIRLVLSGHRPPYRADQFKFTQGHRFICTAEVAWAWAGKRWQLRSLIPPLFKRWPNIAAAPITHGHPLIPVKDAPIPCAFQEAIDKDKLEPVFKGIWR